MYRAELALLRFVGSVFLGFDDMYFLHIHNFVLHYNIGSESDLRSSAKITTKITFTSILYPQFTCMNSYAHHLNIRLYYFNNVLLFLVYGGGVGRILIRLPAILCPFILQSLSDVVLG